ncbi:hypothetical protein FACS1894187_15400 [Synergistales bacterium]|nr:hypothetical protein FACS1894187_15400 [Synergistales bacterium]
MNRMKNMPKKIFKKRAGVTLIETLIAAAIIGLSLPCAFGAFGKLSMAEIKLQDRVDKASCAEWWLNRLPANPTPDDLDAMPTEYKTSGAKPRAFFRWKIERGDYDSFIVILSVANGYDGDASFVAKLVY